MMNNTMPWHEIIEFHREIAIRSEASFFSFNVDDNNSERFSFISQGIVNHMLVEDMIKAESLFNQQILLTLDVKNSEFYVGGIFWFTNKKDYDGKWIKYAHPLFYKPFSIEKYSSGEYKLEPKQARWDISPMFYQLLNKKGIIVEGDSEKIIQGLVENAEKKCGENSFEKTFIDLFVECFPELKKEFVINAPKLIETSWVAFTAPKDYSTIMRMLILDYSKLLKKVDADSNNYGGFLLFEETKVHKIVKKPVKPIIPLNESQLEVVEKVIAGNPVTVVTGPPGCGKSQVVLSILLNAWEKGQSVLFASSNNQAVDVVRNRMRPFERKVDVPLVVRCGSKKMSEIVETFQKMMAAIDDVQRTKLATKSKNEINRINAEIEKLTELLDSNLPYRIEEQLRAALGAYGKAGEYRESIKIEAGQYNNRIKELGVNGDISSFEEKIYEPIIRWKLQHEELLYDLKAAEDKKAELLQKRKDIQSRIAELLMAYYGNYYGERKLNTKGLEERHLWYIEYKEFLLQFIELDLQAVEWSDSFDVWKSSVGASKWIHDANASLESLVQFSNKFSYDIDNINLKSEHMKKSVERLETNGLKMLTDEALETLRNWKKVYGSYILKPKKTFDFLPFSETSKMNKQMFELETLLTEFFGLPYLGIADDSIQRRKYISSHSDEMIEAYLAQNEYVALTSKILEIQNAQKTLNNQLKKIEISPIQNILNKAEFESVIGCIEERMTLAKNAMKAFEKKEKRESVLEKDRQLKFKGSQLFYPLMKGLDKSVEISKFFTYINENIYSELTLESLTEIRTITYKRTIEEYLETMNTAISLWDEIDSINDEISKLKSEDVYKSEWKGRCPSNVNSIFSNLVFERAEKKLSELVDNLETIHNEWITDGKATVEKIENSEKHELEWAWSSIMKALELCPDIYLPEKEEVIEKKIQSSIWDVSYIRGLFAQISSVALTIRQSRLKKELEEALLNQVVNKRITELHDDNTVKAAVSKLYSEYKAKGNVLEDRYEKDFATALKALPIWLTTGQSPQSIPMVPGLFDILIIDEATQCTITALLPLIYRCKRIVVIGDPDQLPAIPSITASAEKFLADNYKLGEYLRFLGHVDCNIYKSVHELIPQKEGNIIFLSDHYRSHPLIIGFANNYVYKKRLALKKSMQEIEDNRILGVFGENVVGLAERETRSDSWCNQKEAEAVVNLIESFKSIPEYSHYSIGVITPFRGQVNLISEMISLHSDITDVLVATVHKYQGDEKDIIIFSPVVSQGMSVGAAKWVEKPQNLINVAVTRAREALYVVSDFAVCKRQQGILGGLIEYVEKIELLRETSMFELHLFGLMVLQGWIIEVHPNIKDIEVDFIVSNRGRKIAIEVDGKQHENQKIADANRDALLASHGLDVVRITTREISETPFETIERIRKGFND